MKKTLTIVQEAVAGINNSLSGTDEIRIPPSYAHPIAKYIEKSISLVSLFPITSWNQRVAPTAMTLIYKDNVGNWGEKMPMNETEKALYIGDGEAILATDGLLERLARKN